MSKVRGRWRDAATLILAAKTNRPSVGNSMFDYRILILKRSAKSSFMPNNYVFPGGVLDKADTSTEWLELYQQSFAQLGKSGFSTILDMKGPRPPIFQKSHNGMPSELALRICVIRETFEESGVLLLKSFATSSSQLMSGCGTALQGWRERIHDDASKFLLMCRELHCVPDVWSLGEWSNWLTPPDLEKRFDTAFFICMVNGEPPVQHDETETTHSEWVTPGEAIVKSISRDIRIAPPQEYELLRFCRFHKWADLVNFQDKRAMEGSEQIAALRIRCSDGLLGLFPHDSMYAEFYEKHVLDEIAQGNSQGPVAIPRYPETIEEMRNSAAALHRVEHVRGSTSLLQCNVTLGHGQIAPLTDSASIAALASSLKPGL